ncbi:MAG: BlaI/MecI/CopY family transcriptional regulator [Pseudomonadota bacterium]
MTNPTPAELEILRILWSLGEAKVQAVNDELCKVKAVGYTTTLKTMQIMEQKGLLGRKKDGKSHIYFPTAEQQDTQSTMLNRLLHSVFSGSKSKLVMQLLGSEKISKQELNDIKAFLADMEKKK